MQRSHDLPREPPGVWAERPGEHHHPLQLLEVLAKGFCPPYIADCVKTHHRASAVADGREAINRVDDANEVSSMTRPADITPNGISYKPCHPESLLVEQATEGYSHQQLSSAQERPFELRERLPTDVLGVSRKILDGFCSNCHFHKSGDNSNSVQQMHHLPSHQNRGFCSVLVGQYRAICLDDKAPIPEGEELSLSSTGSLSVDLSPQSPQSPPIEHRPTSVIRSASSLIDLPCDLTNSIVPTCASAMEGDDEDEPQAEFEVISGHRGKQVLLATILAICVTFAILQQWGHANHQYFQFTLQPKHMHGDTQRSSSLFSLQIARKDVLGPVGVAPVTIIKKLPSDDMIQTNNCTIFSAACGRSASS